MTATLQILAPERRVRLCWADATYSDYGFDWLRDNCPSAFHPETRERVLDLLSIPEDIVPLDAELDENTLTIHWNTDAHISRFDLAWLKERTFGNRDIDPALPVRVRWRGADDGAVIPRFDAASVSTDDASLKDLVQAMLVHGLVVVQNMPTDPNAGMTLARQIGPLRGSNFGETFEVISKPNPNNLAYTSDALPLHTDLPNQETPPGFQFLHCLANSAEGGGSVFADGLAMSDDLAETDPVSFEFLSNVSIPFRFHDSETDLRQHRPVITLRQDGRFSELAWNAHLADTFDMEPDMIAPYYAAYRRMMAMTRDPAYPVTIRLAAGEMAIFDNRRVLHGRESFDPSTGNRHFRGCYVDRGDVESRFRVLSN